MKRLEEIKQDIHLQVLQSGDDGGCGVIKFHPKQKDMHVVFSWGDGWDHVSVSYSNRCPTWDEMCMVKDMFYNDDEVVVQYHPAKADYVNIHPYTLHLWRPQLESMPTPPKYMV